MSEESEEALSILLEKDKYNPITDIARIDLYMAQLLAADVISAGNKMPLCMGDDGPEWLNQLADLSVRAIKAVDSMAAGEKYYKGMSEINVIRAKRGAKPVWVDDE
jgi:hypothetical protein